MAAHSSILASQTLLEGHLALLAHWTSPWGRRVRFWHCLGASVCKVTAASLVTPIALSGTDAVCVLRCHPTGCKASPLPCDGSLRQCISPCHQPSTQSYWAGYSVPVGVKYYKQRQRTGIATQRCLLHISWTTQAHICTETFKYCLYLFSLSVLIDFGTTPTTFRSFSCPQKRGKAIRKQKHNSCW